MQIDIRQIAELIGGDIEGDEGILISGVSGIKEARQGEITFVANKRYSNLMETTNASAIIVSRDIERSNSRTLIKTDDPYLAFTRVMRMWANGNGDTQAEAGIHPTAVIGKNAKLGEGVSIQAFAVIGDDVEIGDNVVIYPQVYIGRKTKIGEETLIYPRVTIREKISIGKRCIIHSGTVIGSDGFGFAPVKGTHHKVPQIGTVIIEDDVEIGANVAIDRATIGKTQIGRGTKIDNLVQIAHNVTIGNNSIIVAQVGLSGSSTIGSGVTIAGQAGVTGHIVVGDNSTVAARSGVTKSVPPNSCVSGFPAQPHDKEKRLKVSLLRVPETNKKIRDLEKRIRSLESMIDKDNS